MFNSKKDKGNAVEEKGMNLLCIDPGRSSIKIRAKLVKVKFMSIISEVDMNLVESFNWIKHSRFILLNKRVYCIGDDAVRYSRNVVYVNNDDLFVENIRFFVYESLVRVYEQHGSDFIKNCKIAIDMTWNNYRLKDKIKKEVKGIQSVVYRDSSGDHKIDVNITGMFFLYQGWCGLMDHVLDNEGLYPQDKQNIVTGRGVVMDIGRSTTDITHVNKLIPYEGESVEFGTINIFQRMVRYIHNKYGMNLKLFEVEDACKNDRAFKTLGGESILAKKVYDIVIKESVNEFREVLLERLGGKVNDFVILMGGGGEVFYPYFQKEFALLALVEQPEFANVQGMYKFLQKMLKQGKIEETQS